MTKTTAEAIPACRFCGSGAREPVATSKLDNAHSWTIECRRCGARQTRRTLPDVVAAWSKGIIAYG